MRIPRFAKVIFLSLLLITSMILGTKPSGTIVAYFSSVAETPINMPTTDIAVTTTTDELNSDGDCSLREAVQAANTHTQVDACPAGNGDDTIILSANTYTLTIEGRSEDENAEGDLDIIGGLTIIGTESSTTMPSSSSLMPATLAEYTRPI